MVKSKEKGKMDEILKKLITLVGQCEFSTEEKEKNLLSRILEKSEVSFKSLKSTSAVANDFSKNKNKRQTQERDNRK